MSQCHFALPQGINDSNTPCIPTPNSEISLKIEIMQKIVWDPPWVTKYYKDWVNQSKFISYPIYLYISFAINNCISHLLNYIQLIIFKTILFYYHAKCITSWQVNFSFSLYTKVPISHFSMQKPPNIFWFNCYVTYSSACSRISQLQH